MKPLKRAVSAVYLIASLIVLGTYGLSLAGPFTGRMAELRAEPAFRWLLFACMAIMAVQALYVLGLALFTRPDLESVHPDGAPDIEVTCAAIASVARAAALEEDVLVEDVRVRATGHAHESARVQVDAIALGDGDLAGLAHRMQGRIADACERMLGATGVTARVRFLPSKTTTVTKEVSGE